MPAQTFLECSELSKSYGHMRVLDRISCRIDAGEHVGLVGRNGAGKTTLLSIMAGLRRPDSGRVQLFGGSPVSAQFRTELGLTPQTLSFPEVFRVGEVLNHVRGHYAEPAALGDLCETFGLAPLVKKPVGALSGGQKRLLGSCLAFAGNPRLVILDEPTAGLDSETRERLWDIILAKKETSMLITSQNIEDIEHLAERVIVLHRGRIMSDLPIEDVLKLSQTVTITVQESLPNDLSWLISGRAKAIHANAFKITTSDIDATMRELLDCYGTYRHIEANRDALETSIRRLTADAP